MNKIKITSLILVLVFSIATSSFATSELVTIEKQEIVPIEDVDSYRNFLKNEIESDGIIYQLKNVEETKNKSTLTKDKEIKEDIIVTKDNKYDVLNKFDSKKEITEDGYSGILKLQNDSLEIVVNESYTEDYKVSLQKVYNNVSTNELNNIPKEIQEDGTLYYLVNPIWNVSSTEKIGNNDVPLTYDGIMNYEGIKTRTIIKNYKASVSYIGTLQKEEVESVTFRMTYEGTKEEADYTIPIVVAGTTSGIIIFSGIVWVRKKKAKDKE